MPKLKAGILKPGITKIKHRTDKGWFHNCLVFVYFYSQFYSLLKNFWLAEVVNFQYNINRAQKKPVSMIFIRNLEIKSRTVFCIAKVSLFCLDRSVVTLHRRASMRLHHLSLSLIFYSQPVFSLFYSYFNFLLIIKYDIHSNSQSEGSGKRCNRNFLYPYRPITS